MSRFQFWRRGSQETEDDSKNPSVSGLLDIICGCQQDGSSCTETQSSRRVTLRSYLHRNPSEIQVTDSNGNTPLHLACSNPTWASDLRSIIILIEASEKAEGAKVENEETTEAPATTRTTNCKSADVAPNDNLILRQKNRKGETALHRAVQYASTSVVAHLVRSCPLAVYMADNNGNLPLHVACQRATYNPVSLKRIWILIQQWPESIRKVNVNGDLPLHLAVQTPTRDKIVEAVEVAEEEDINIRVRQQLDIVQYLVTTYPESVHCKNQDGRRALQVAIQGAAVLYRNKHRNYNSHPVVAFLDDFTDGLSRRMIQKAIFNVSQNHNSEEISLENNRTHIVANVSKEATGETNDERTGSQIFRSPDPSLLSDKDRIERCSGKKGSGNHACDSSLTTMTYPESDDEELKTNPTGDSLDEASDDSNCSTLFENFLADTRDQIQRYFDKDQDKGPLSSNFLFLCRRKIKQDYKAMLNISLEEDADEVTAHTAAANHVFQEFLMYTYDFQHNDYLEKNKQCPHDKHTCCLALIYSEMESCLLTELTAFSNLRFKSLSACDAALMLAFYESFLQRSKEAARICDAIQPSIIWRADKKKILEHLLLEQGVRPEIEKSIAERHLWQAVRRGGESRNKSNHRLTKQS